MTLISLLEAKAYLRVDSSDEDALIGVLLSAAEQMCVDVARLSLEQWREVKGEQVGASVYSAETCKGIAAIMKGAVLYALGYLYEHREEADHHGLILTLRSILFAVREGVNF